MENPLLSHCAQNKGQIFLLDAFLFILICLFSLVVLFSAPLPRANESLEEYAIAQDAAESCALTKNWAPECFSVLEKMGFSYCFEKGCGEVNLERACCGKTVYIGVSQQNTSYSG